MEFISSRQGIDYISMINDSKNYSYFDGNHLTKESAESFSKNLADIILRNQ